MFIFIFIILSLSGKDVAMNVLINTAMVTIYHRYYRDTLNRNWKDKRNKTSFKSIFCILSWYTIKTRNVPHHPRKIYPYA